MIQRLKLNSILSNYQRQLFVFASLSFSTILCLGMLALRAWHYHSSTQRWLVWNLFLAWLPALGAFAAYNLHHWPTRLRWLPILGFAFLWLLFLPNATYLITDIIHLKPNSVVPLWYDLITLVAFAWTGSFLGLISLFLMQELVRRMIGRAASWLFVVGVLMLNGFGVYFGRFLRWNSWDALFRPSSLVNELVDGLLHPMEHMQTLAFAGLFTLLFSAVYLMMLSFTHLHLDHQQR